MEMISVSRYRRVKYEMKKAIGNEKRRTDVLGLSREQPVEWI